MEHRLAHSVPPAAQKVLAESSPSPLQSRYDDSRADFRRFAPDRWANEYWRGQVPAIFLHQRKVPCCAAKEIQNQLADISSGDGPRLQLLLMPQSRRDC